MLCDFSEDYVLELAQYHAPYEVCGVVYDGLAIPVTNIAHRLGEFELSPEELEELYETRGKPDGIWHSHPGGKPTPSDMDWQYHPAGLKMYIVTLTAVYEYDG